MLIKVVRKQFLPDRCLGELYLNDKFLCYTLEDVDRGLKQSMTNTEIDKIKINAATACPSGKYRIILSFSSKLKRFLPLLLDVPRGKGVRIHKGSDIQWTSACILVGTGISKKNTLTGIVKAEDILMKELKKVNEHEAIYIEIVRHGV